MTSAALEIEASDGVEGSRRYKSVVVCRLSSHFPRPFRGPLGRLGVRALRGGRARVPVGVCQSYYIRTCRLDERHGGTRREEPLRVDYKRKGWI